MRLFGDIGSPRRFRWSCLVTSGGLGGSDEIVWWHQTVKEVPIRLFGDIRPLWRVGWDCLETWDHQGGSKHLILLEALNSVSLTSTGWCHKTINFSKWEWEYFTHQFYNQLLSIWMEQKSLSKFGQNSHAIIHFQQRHCSFEGHTWLSNYCIHYNNGFLTALKWIQAVNNYYTYLPVRRRANWNL
jgi:hypothetical protein